VSKLRKVTCPACGTENEVLAPDDSFSEQQMYASFRFTCRSCGAELPPNQPVEGGEGPEPA
jgi:hypothetical protein